MGSGAARSLVAVAILVLVACSPGPPPDGSPTGVCRPDPFTPEVRGVLDAAGAARHHLTIAAYDDRSGCWYHFAPGVRVTTASVVKAEIMAGVLLRAQRAGRVPDRGELARIGPMMTRSDDASASALWSSLGGEPGMERVGADLGLVATDEVAPTWGLSTTTAEDQARFIASMVQGPGPLDVPARSVAWAFLTSVVPAQRWGVPAGVPAGWTVGHKNGFAGSTCCGWRVNSVGYVADPNGGGYAIAVLSDGWPNLGAGIPLVEAGARVVASALAT